MRTVPNRLTGTLAALALAAGTLLAGTAVPAAVADRSPTAAVRGEEPMTCQELWDSLPEQLRADIRAARALPPRAQARALLVIRRAALGGIYGERVQRLAEERRERRRELWAVFPEQLKDDLRAAWSLPFHAQRRALRVIRRDALAGDYGERVQELAEARAQWLSTCPRVDGAV